MPSLSNARMEWQEIKRLLDDPARRVEGLTRLTQSDLRYAPSKAVELLSDADEQVRLQALDCLRMRGSRYHAKHVAKRLSDRSWRVRVDAVVCLSGWRAKSKLGAVTALLDDPNEHVRLYAARAIGTLGSGKDIGLLRGKLATESSATACAGYCVALARLTGQVAWLEELADMLADPDERLRCVAANSLMDAITPDTAGHVAALLRDALAREGAATARRTMTQNLWRLEGPRVAAVGPPS